MNRVTSGRSLKDFSIWSLNTQLRDLLLTLGHLAKSLRFFTNNNGSGVVLLLVSAGSASYCLSLDYEYINQQREREKERERKKEINDITKDKHSSSVCWSFP